MNILLALLWFAVGFLAVNGLKALHIRRSEQKSKLKPALSNLPETERIKTAYRKSLPYTPLYYLVVWIVCSIFYFSMHTPGNIYLDALFTGIFWWLLTLLLEMLIWVRVKHPMQLTWKEMFMQSQPWLSLDYYAVLISPLILSLILK